MNRRVLLIAVGAGVALLVVWYLALWSPRSKAIDEARERQEAAQLRQDDLRLRISRLQAAQRDEPAKRARLEALRAAVPDEPNLAQFILDTNDAATRAGIDFLSISPAQPGAGTPQAPATIGVTLSISGGYFQVLDFINRLSTAPRLVVISSLNVGGLNAQQRLSVGLTAQIYTAGGEPGSAPVPPGVPGATTTTVPAGTTATTAAPAATTVAP